MTVDGLGVEPLVYDEATVAALFGVHRTTIRAQAMHAGSPLSACVIQLTPSKRVYPREAIHRLVGLVARNDHEKVA